MNPRTTVLLLLVLAALGGAAWFLRPSGDVDPWAKPTENLAETRRPPLLETLGLDAHRITQITFAPSGKPGLTIARVGDAWKLAKPFQLALKPAQVEALLILPLTETHVLGADAAPTGAAHGHVEITTANGKTVRLDLGAHLGAGVGTLHAPGGTRRVSTHLHDLLADLPPLVALIHPQLDLPPAGRLAALTVDSGKSHLRVTRGKDGGQAGFALDLPGAPRASADAVALYCAELRKLSIVEIPRESAADAIFGFDNSPVTVVLEETGGAKTKLEVGGPTGPDLKRYFIRLTPPSGAPLVAAVETEQVQALPQGVEFFRDWRVSGIKAGDVRKLRVEQDGKTTLELSLDADGKVVFADKAVPFVVDAELGKAALAALANMKPTSAGQAAAKPTHRVVLTDAFGRTETFAVATGEKNCAIQREGDAEGFTVPKEQVEVLLGGVEGLRDREIRWLPEGGEITEIKFNAFQFVKTDGKWATKDGIAFDEPSIVALEQALRYPAVKFFYPKDISKSYVANHHLDALAKTSSGEHRFHLDMNLAGLGNMTMPDQSQPLVMMPEAFVAILNGEFRPRQLLALAPEKIAWIEIAVHGGKPALRVTRGEGGAYTPHIDASRPEDARNLGKLTQADCAALFDALGNLRAEQPMSVNFAWGGPHGHVLRLHETGGKDHTLTLWHRRAVFGDELNGRAFHWHGRQDEAVKAVFDKLGWFYLAQETK